MNAQSEQLKILVQALGATISGRSNKPSQVPMDSFRDHLVLEGKASEF